MFTVERKERAAGHIRRNATKLVSPSYSHHYANCRLCSNVTQSWANSKHNIEGRVRRAKGEGRRDGRSRQEDRDAVRLLHYALSDACAHMRLASREKTRTPTPNKHDRTYPRRTRPSSFARRSRAMYHRPVLPRTPSRWRVPWLPTWWQALRSTSCIVAPVPLWSLTK